MPEVPIAPRPCLLDSVETQANMIRQPSDLIQSQRSTTPNSSFKNIQSVEAGAHDRLLYASSGERNLTGKLVDRERKLTCPFFARNPSKYSKIRSCSGPGWDSAHRVKEHIYRKHTKPQLSSYSERNSMGEEDRVDAIKERQLRSRKLVDNRELERRGSTDLCIEERRWYKIYQILFPYDPPDKAPSPYYTESVLGSSGAGNTTDRLGVDLPSELQGQLASMTHDLAKDVAEMYMSAQKTGNLEDLQPQTHRRSYEFTQAVLGMLTKPKQLPERGSSEVMGYIDPYEVSDSIQLDEAMPVQAFGTHSIDTFPFTFTPAANVQLDTVAPMNANVYPGLGISNPFMECWDMGGSNLMFPYTLEDSFQLDMH